MEQGGSSTPSNGKRIKRAAHKLPVRRSNRQKTTANRKGKKSTVANISISSDESISSPHTSPTASPSPTPPPSPPKARTTDPTDMSRVFTTDAQKTRYDERFSHRTVIDPHYMVVADMVSWGFTFQKHIAEQGLEKFVNLNGKYFDKLVLAFYSSMQVKKGTFISYLYGRRLIVTDVVRKEVIGLESNGNIAAFDQEDFADYDKYEALKEMLKNPNHIPTSTTLTAGKFNLEDRLLHYAIARILNRRMGNFARVHDEDVRLMWAISKGKKINWPTYFIAVMQKSFVDDSSVPYACLISKFIRHFRVHTPMDTTVEVRDKYCFSRTTITRMGMIKKRDGWVY